MTSAAQKYTDEERSFAKRLARNGWQLVQQNQLEDAVLLLEAANVVLSEDPDVWAALGIAYARSQKVHEALASLQTALLLDDKRIELWCIVAELSIERFDYALSLQAITKCLALDPDSKHPAGIRARALIKKAEKQLRQATGK
jgi:cytochrome c-type biogenesis protein CcmH/NrfG